MALCLPMFYSQHYAECVTLGYALDMVQYSAQILV